MTTYEEFVEKIHGFGRYQKLYVSLILCPVIIMGASAGMIFIFILFTPDHTCKIPTQLVSSAPSNVKNGSLDFAIPKEDIYNTGTLKPSQCKIFDFSVTDWNYVERSSNETTKCPEGHVFDQSDWVQNVVTEFDITCDNTWRISFIYSMTSVGGAIGTIAGAAIQDNFGRKHVFFVGVIFSTLLGCLFTVTKSWEAFAAINVIQSMAGSATFNQPWILALEFSGVEYHSVSLILTCVAFAIGCFYAALIAYLTKYWRHTILIAYLPRFLFILAWPFVDESPRWLLSKDRKEEAHKILKKMARVNRVAVPDEEVEKVELKTTDQKAHPPWAVCSNWNIAWKTIIMSWIWTVVSMVYQGLTLNTENLGGNMYLVFVLSSLVEIPAVFMAKATDYVGRIWPMSLGLLIGGIMGVISAAIPYENTAAIVACTVIMKLCITLSFDLIILVSSELYPTILRGTGLSMTSILPTIASIVTPFIILSASTQKMLPLLIFAGLSLSGAVVSLFLPETMGVPLPDTLEDEKNRRVGVMSLKDNFQLKAIKDIKSAKHMRKIAPMKMDAEIKREIDT